MTGHSPAIALRWHRLVLRSDVSRGAKLLAGALLDYMDPDGSNCRPGDRLLALDLAVTERTIKEWRRELVRAGLLRCAHRGHSGGRGGGPGEAAVWRPVIPVNEGNEVSPDSVNEGNPRSPHSVNEGKPDVRMRGSLTYPHLPRTSPLLAEVGNQGAGSGPPPELIEFVIGSVHERTGKTITRTDADRCIRIKFDEYGGLPPAPRHHLGNLIAENPDWWLTGR